MRVTVISPPSSEPVTVAEAKSHLRVDASDENTQISAMITAARQWCEAYCNRAIGLQTLRLDLPRFPREVDLPRPVFRTLDSIQYLDADGVLQTLATSNYRVLESSDVQPAKLELAPNASLPSVLKSDAAVRITYRAGWDTTGSPADVVPESIRVAILMLVGDLYEHREARLDAESHDNPTVRAILAPWRIYTL